MPPIIIAHRGLHTQYPENSLAAFAAAEAAGIGYLECDVWPSRDGVPVILHDQTLDRTTPGHGKVGDHTAAELAALGVPSLADLILQSSTDTTLVVEIKPDNAEDFVRSVVNLLAKQHPLAIVQSFDYANLQHSQRIAPAIPVAMLIEHAARLRRPWPVPIHVRHDLIESEMVEARHAAGLAVGAWTVNQPAEIRTLLVLGVDRIISDDPLLCENLKSEI